MANNFAFEVKVDLCLKYTFTGGGWGLGWGGGGGLEKPIIMLISAPVGFELGLGAELGNKILFSCPAKFSSSFLSNI